MRLLFDATIVLPTMKPPARILLIFALIVATVGCDRLTKRMAMTSLPGAPDRSYLGDTVRLQYAENPGGFLSIGSDLSPSVRTAIFIIATGCILLALTIVAMKHRGSNWHIVAISLALAGGVSNLIDRVTRGAVVDFLNIGVGQLRTGVFNVADVAIFAGTAALLLFGFRKP
jgi:signal peptidase II